jgi:hypothetical protein
MQAARRKEEGKEDGGQEKQILPILPLIGLQPKLSYEEKLARMIQSRDTVKFYNAKPKEIKNLADFRLDIGTTTPSARHSQ